jgi:hypothetical protein
MKEQYEALLATAREFEQFAADYPGENGPEWRNRIHEVLVFLDGVKGEAIKE